MLILIAEPDPYVAALQRALLADRYPVHFVSDGTEALEAARRLLPRLVIADILVPRLDGLHLCRLLKSDARTRQIRVLIFSELLAERRAREAGADAYLKKPVDEARFIAEVRGLLEPAAPAEAR